MVSIQTESSYIQILTADELNDIVRKSLKTVDNVNVIKYEIKSDPNAFGYLGEYFRLAVHVESVSKHFENFNWSDSLIWQYLNQSIFNALVNSIFILWIRLRLSVR